MSKKKTVGKLSNIEMQVIEIGLRRNDYKIDSVLLKNLSDDLNLDIHRVHLYCRELKIEKNSIEYKIKKAVEQKEKELEKKFQEKLEQKEKEIEKKLQEKELEFFVPDKIKNKRRRRSRIIKFK